MPAPSTTASDVPSDSPHFSSIRFIREPRHSTEPPEVPSDGTRFPWWQRIGRIGAVRKAILLGLLAIGWHLYARHLDNPLALPGVGSVARAFARDAWSGELPARALLSLRLLFSGYLLGIAGAMVLCVLAMTTRPARDLLETLTAMFNPLPAIALLPLALLWFGIGTFSIVFVIIHAVLWPIALSVLAGFASVSATTKLVGRNYGLSRPRFAVLVLIPAAFPAIVTGLKNGWAFAWRTLIAAELVFGVSSGSGGLGWFIYEKKNQLEMEAVFAGFCSVILLGVLFEHCVFRPLERRTLQRWGMRS